MAFCIIIDLFVAYKYSIYDVFHWFCKIARFFATEPIVFEIIRKYYLLSVIFVFITLFNELSRNWLLIELLFRRVLSQSFNTKKKAYIYDIKF